MFPATSRKSKNKREIRFPGICRFVAMKWRGAPLKKPVNRIHAWKVLSGRRHSRRLMDAWEKFQQLPKH